MSKSLDGEKMKDIKIYTEYITLGQFLKIADIIQTGGEAKMYLSDATVLVNGINDNRRGRKLREGDVIEVENQVFVIKKCE